METPHTIQLPANYRISVKALIKSPEDPSKFMLIREEDGQWELPGGGLDHGEDRHVGLKREIQEEIGAEVRSISKSPIDFWTIYRKVSENLGYFGFVLYEVSLEPGELTPSEEAMEVGYFTIDEAKELPLHANIQDYIGGL